MKIQIQVMIVTLLLALVNISCVGQQKQPNVSDSQKINDNSQTGQGVSGGTAYEAAESLARRLVLYKLAWQEGDMAPFTAMPEAVSSINLPGITKQLNEFWWNFPWEGARLSPLPSTEITSLESKIFPLIATRLEETDEENRWVLFTLGYDPDILRVLISNAHKEWVPEERELYLGGQLDDCLQIWCVKISGEWKILAHLPCQGDTSRPVPPQPPMDLFNDPATGQTSQSESTAETEESAE